MPRHPPDTPDGLSEKKGLFFSSEIARRVCRVWWVTNSSNLELISRREAGLAPMQPSMIVVAVATLHQPEFPSATRQHMRSTQRARSELKSARSELDRHQSARLRRNAGPGECGVGLNVVASIPTKIVCGAHSPPRRNSSALLCPPARRVRTTTDTNGGRNATITPNGTSQAYHRRLNECEHAGRSFAPAAEILGRSAPARKTYTHEDTATKRQKR